MSDETPLSSQLELAKEFNSATPNDWRQAAEQLLKGKEFDKTLLTETYEKITLKPIYHSSDCAAALLSKPTSGWEISQELPYAGAGEFNKALLADLQLGQKSANLVLDSAGHQGQDALPSMTTNGTAISTYEDLQAALQDVDLSKVPLHIEAGLAAPAVAAFLVKVCEIQNIDARKLTGSIATDPLAELAKNGSIPGAAGDLAQQLTSLTVWAKEQMPAMKTIGVNVNPYHNAGASAVQELACAIATGAEYVRRMLAAGNNLQLEDITSRMRFSFATGSNFFMEMAKLRAARLIWSEIVEAFGGNRKAQQMFIHARCSNWNKSVCDRHVNLLRATTEAMSAVAGGCDSLHVAPFDSTIQPPDEFSRRIARNIQLILQAESHLDHVADPASGSWYVESLTREIAEQAWKFFQKIEEKGGMLPALQDGFLQSEIARTAQRRAQKISLREDKFIGANVFPNPKDDVTDLKKHSSSDFYQQRVTDLAKYKAARKSESISSALEDISRSRQTKAEKSMVFVLAAAKARATLEEICDELYSNSESKIEAAKLEIHRGLAAVEKEQQVALHSREI